MAEDILLTSEQCENDFDVFSPKKSARRCPLGFDQITLVCEIKNVSYVIEIKPEIATTQIKTNEQTIAEEQSEPSNGKLYVRRKHKQPRSK